MLTCPACNVEGQAGPRFCRSCGAPLASRCPRCGALTSPRDRFCGDCGIVLTPSVPIIIASGPPRSCGEPLAEAAIDDPLPVPPAEECVMP